MDFSNGWGSFGGPFSGGFVSMQLMNLVLLAIWIWILVDCARRPFKNMLEKVFWIVAMIAAPLVGSIAYLAVVKYSNPDGVLDDIQAAWNKTIKKEEPTTPPAPSTPTTPSPTPNTPGPVIPDNKPIDSNHTL